MGRSFGSRVRARGAEIDFLRLWLGCGDGRERGLVSGGSSVAAEAPEHESEDDAGHKGSGGDQEGHPAVVRDGRFGGRSGLQFDDIGVEIHRFWSSFRLWLRWRRSDGQHFFIAGSEAGETSGSFLGVANDAISEGLESLLVALSECIGPGGKDFEDPHELAPIPQGHDKDGTNAEQATSSGVDTRIGLGIITALQGSDTQTLGGETCIVEANAEIGSSAACGSAADHLAIAGEGNGGASRTGSKTGLLDDLVQNQVQGKILRSISAATCGQSAGQAANFRVRRKGAVDVR